MDSVALVWPVPRKAPTAAAVRLEAFARAAGALGFRVWVIAPPLQLPATPQEIELPLYDTLSKRGVVWATLGFPWSIITLVRFLSTNECRCVIASTPAPFAPLQAAVAARILGIPFVLDVRDSWEMEALTHRGVLRNRLKGIIEGLCARSASDVWYVTRRLMADLNRNLRLPADVGKVVPNGADLTLFHPRDVVKDTDLVFAGSPARYRNVPGILDSLAKLREILPRVSAMFVGWTDSPDLENIQGMIRERGLSEHVRVLPAVPHEQVPQLLSTARLGIVSLTSDSVLRGAVGAKAYEYLACGLPLACLGPTGESELRTLTETHLVGFFATTPGEFAFKAARLLTDSNLLDAMSKNCRSAAQLYDRKEISKQAFLSTVSPLIRNKERRH